MAVLHHWLFSIAKQTLVVKMSTFIAPRRFEFKRFATRDDVLKLASRATSHSGRAKKPAQRNSLSRDTRFPARCS